MLNEIITLPFFPYTGRVVKERFQNMAEIEIIETNLDPVEKTNPEWAKYIYQNQGKKMICLPFVFTRK